MVRQAVTVMSEHAFRHHGCARLANRTWGLWGCRTPHGSVMPGWSVAASLRRLSRAFVAIFGNSRPVSHQIPPVGGRAGTCNLIVWFRIYRRNAGRGLGFRGTSMGLGGTNGLMGIAADVGGIGSAGFRPMRIDRKCPAGVRGMIRGHASDTKSRRAAEPGVRRNPTRLSAYEIRVRAENVQGIRERSEWA